MTYDHTKFQKLISLEVPYKIALALADDDSPLIQEIPDALVAANVAEIADPASATAEEVGDKVNELIAALVDAGLMDAP